MKETTRIAITKASAPAAPMVEQDRAVRRPYRQPRLVPYGRVGSLTMGGSKGVNESGAEKTRRNVFFGEDPYAEFLP